MWAMKNLVPEYCIILLFFLSFGQLQSSLQSPAFFMKSQQLEFLTTQSILQFCLLYSNIDVAEIRVAFI